MANEDVGFRARGPRNQFIPPITEENLRDNAYATMKKGGVVKKKTKKGKATASATAIVNVYTGRRRTAPAQPRPPKPPQPINVSVQLPNYLQSNMSEPFQNIRLQERINDIQAQMLKMSEPLQTLKLNGMPTRPNVGEPIRQQDAYEPYDPIEMKHEKEPDELIVMEQDLQPPEIQEAVGDEAPIRRKRRTKEETEIARLAKEEKKRIKDEAKQQQEEAKKRLAELKEEQDTERLFNQIRQVRMEIVKRQREDPNHPQLPQLRKQLDKLTKK